MYAIGVQVSAGISDKLQSTRNKQQIISKRRISKMSEFEEKCSGVLTGRSIGAMVGGSIGAALTALGVPVTPSLGATIGGAIGSICWLFSDLE